MEQVIKQLYEIEAEAAKIMEDTANKQKELSASTDKKIEKFDKKLRDETLRKLAAYKDELSRQTDKNLKKLEESTKEMIKLMKDVYNNHHSNIAKELFETVIKEHY